MNFHVLNANELDKPPQLSSHGIRSFWCLVSIAETTFSPLFMFLSICNEMFFLRRCQVLVLKMLMMFLLWVFLGIKGVPFLVSYLFCLLLLFSLRFIKFLWLTFKNIWFYVKFCIQNTQSVAFSFHLMNHETLCSGQSDWKQKLMLLCNLKNPLDLKD